MSPSGDAVKRGSNPRQVPSLFTGSWNVRESDAAGRFEKKSRGPAPALVAAAAAGSKLKQARDRLGLRYRDVEMASRRIAERTGNSEYVVSLSRLFAIEHGASSPTLYRLYSLCAIYEMDLIEILRWYGIEVDALRADSIKDIPLVVLERRQRANMCKATNAVACSLSDLDDDVAVPV